MILRIALILLQVHLLCWSHFAAACEDEHPPVERTPVVERTLVDGEGNPVVELMFDPRGVAQVRTAQESDDKWVKNGDDSGAWDYREWQWWKGHPWGDSCRPRFWTTPQFAAEEQQISIRYKIDGFDCRQLFLLPKVVEEYSPHWDVVITIHNESGEDVQEYGQFFACYSQFNQPNSFWFWESGNRLMQFAAHGVEHLNGFVVHPEAYFVESRAIPHFPRGGGKIVSTWHRPVLVSHASPAGWRSVILVEAQYAAGLAQGIRGAAMDYFVFPGANEEVFADGAEFAVHVRHHLLYAPELPTTELLANLWGEFEKSHSIIHELAKND